MSEPDLIEKLTQRVEELTQRVAELTELVEKLVKLNKAMADRMGRTDKAIEYLKMDVSSHEICD